MTSSRIKKDKQPISKILLRHAQIRVKGRGYIIYTEQPGIDNMWMFFINWGTKYRLSQRDDTSIAVLWGKNICLGKLILNLTSAACSFHSYQTRRCNDLHLPPVLGASKRSFSKPLRTLKTANHCPTLRQSLKLSKQCPKKIDKYYYYNYYNYYYYYY